MLEERRKLEKREAINGTFIVRISTFQTINKKKNKAEFESTRRNISLQRFI